MERLNKMIVAMIVIIVILLAILSAVIIYTPKKMEQADNEKVETEVSDEILDDCTEEYEEMQEEIISTDSEQEKISPNCEIILKKYYKKCRDEINEYIKVPEYLVNCTRVDLEKQYKDWDIKEFSSNKIILYKEFEGECGEHYMLRDDDGKIVVYKVLENGKEALYEKTDISIDYLPEGDSNSIKNGLKIDTKEKLNEFIESFE